MAIPSPARLLVSVIFAGGCLGASFAGARAASAPASSLAAVRASIEAGDYRAGEARLRRLVAVIGAGAGSAKAEDGAEVEEAEEARFLLARVLSARGELSPAIAQFRRLRQGSPERTELLFGEAHLLLRTRRPEEALPLLRVARRVSPWDEEVYRLQIRALWQAGDSSAAKTVLREAIQRFPEDDWGAAHLTRESQEAAEARAAAAAGEFSRAETALRSWLGAHPSDHSARRSLARVLAWSGKDAAAAAEESRLLSRGPFSFPDLMLQARALLALGKRAEAVPISRRAQALKPGCEEVFRLLLRSLGDDPEERRAVRDEAKRRFPDVPWVVAFPARDASQSGPSEAAVGR